MKESFAGMAIEVEPGRVTVMWTDPLPAGATAVICVAELTTKLAAVAPKSTAVAPVKPLPSTMTDVPADPTAPLRVGDTLPVPLPVVVPAKATVKDPVPPVTTGYTPAVSPFDQPPVEISWPAVHVPVRVDRDGAARLDGRGRDQPDAGHPGDVVEDVAVTRRHGGGGSADGHDHRGGRRRTDGGGRGKPP